MQIESKIGKINRNQEDIYALLSDFSKAASMLPPDKIKDAIIEPDSIKVSHPEAGDIEFSIIEREPSSLVKYSGVIKKSFDFFMWVQLKSVSPGDTRIKITVKAEVPSMMGWAIKGKIKGMLDQLIDRIEKM